MSTKSPSGSGRQAVETEATRQAVEALQASKEAIQQAIQEVVKSTRQEVAAAVRQASSAAARAGDKEEKAGPLRPEALPHAFAVMPFGKKKGADGSPYDFNAIYHDLIKPALIEAGFEPFRADEATTSGDILTDMFQELLLADLVICDMSIDNANAYYELGIRHAFRKRGVVHIQAGRAYMPFDVFNVRTLPYHITPEGLPDPKFLETDRQAITRLVRDTWNSDQQAIHSPVFNLLTGLDEPDRKALQTPLATGFWKEHEAWQERMQVAQRQNRIGDILMLIEEVTNPLVKEDAIRDASKALANNGRHELALELYRKGLEANPGNLNFRRQEAFHLNRLKRRDEAITKIEAILAEHPADSETIAYLGRIYKEMWTDSWNKIEDQEQRLQTAFDSRHWLIKSFHSYLKGFEANLNEFYPGINAFTLGSILAHLAGRYEAPGDPDIPAVCEKLPTLRSALDFLLEVKCRDDSADYWMLASRAELRLLTADAPAQVAHAYRQAVIASRRNPSFLQSSIGQLKMLCSLEMRPEMVQAGMELLQEELERIEQSGDGEAAPQKGGAKPAEGQVFLFTGYNPDTEKSRDVNFPPEIEPQVKDAIQETLKKLNAGPNDLAVIPGLSAGGEILFAECCTELGMEVKAYLPSPESAYVRDFVLPFGASWGERYYKLRNNSLVSERFQKERLGKVRPGDDLYLRNNRWALYSSLFNGIDKVCLIALWDGKGGAKLKDRDSRLVKHMVELMWDTGGRMEQINPSRFIQPDLVSKPKRKN